MPKTKPGVGNHSGTPRLHLTFSVWEHLKLGQGARGQDSLTCPVLARAHGQRL